MVTMVAIANNCSFPYNKDLVMLYKCIPNQVDIKLLLPKENLPNKNSTYLYAQSSCFRGEKINYYTYIFMSYTNCFVHPSVFLSVRPSVRMSVCMDVRYDSQLAELLFFLGAFDVLHMLKFYVGIFFLVYFLSFFYKHCVNVIKVFYFCDVVKFLYTTDKDKIQNHDLEEIVNDTTTHQCFLSVKHDITEQKLCLEMCVSISLTFLFHHSSSHPKSVSRPSGLLDLLEDIIQTTWFNFNAIMPHSIRYFIILN